MTECGCKGIRTCRLCEDEKEYVSIKARARDHVVHYSFCVYCSGVVASLEGHNCNTGSSSATTTTSANTTYSLSNDTIESVNTLNAEIGFNGVHVVEDFITEQQEQDMVAHMDQHPWASSQSGRHKQVYLCN